MLSYWEREYLLNFDIIIIGAGIVGLNAAIDLRIKYPAATIAVFERSILPTGASTRNAGFACFGSVAELMEDAKTQSPEQLHTLFVKRKKGIDKLRKRLGDDAIGYSADGSHELLKADEAYLLDDMCYLNKLLKDIDNQPVFSIANEAITKNGFSSRQFKYAIAANLEGSINTGSMMHALLQLCLKEGIQVITGANVLSFEELPAKVILNVADTVRNTSINYTCRQLIVCTNAFTQQFFPDEDIQPGRGQVMITQPIPNLIMRGIFHFDKGYYYFRALNDRILIGGGRNMDIETEHTTVFASNNLILDSIKELLHNDICPAYPYEIDMAWSGIMAFGTSKNPIVKSFGDRIHGAFRLGGMGVALGTHVAAEVTSLITDI